MAHVTHPTISIPVAPARRRVAPTVAAQSEASSIRTESIAAPLTLAAVVVGTLMLAVAIAVVTALGA